MSSFAQVVCLLLVTSSAIAGGDLLTPEETQYLQQNTEIRFVCQPDYPPYEFIDGDGELQGVYVELVRWMSTELGFQALFSVLSPEETQEAVLNGTADVVTSLLDINSHQKQIDFSVPVFEINSMVYVKSGTMGISSISDLQGKSVAIMAENRAIKVLVSRGINCSVVVTENTTDAIHLLLEGEVDALVGEDQVVEYHLVNYHNLEDVEVVGEPLYSNQLCMVVTGDDSVLCSILGRGIEYAIKDGIIDGIYGKWRGSPLHVSEGNKYPYLNRLFTLIAVVVVAAILVFVWNIRLRHAVEAKTRSLEKSEFSLHQALDQANLGSWDYNLVTGKAINNQRYSLMLGYEPGEKDFSYENWLDQVHPEDRKTLEAYIQEFLKQDSGQFEIEYRMKNKNGEWVYIHSRGGVVERDHNGKPTRISGVHQDVTRRKQSEFLARKAIEDWESTFDALPELIAVLDSEGLIAKVNKAQARALGLTRKECVGKNLCSLMFPDGHGHRFCLPGNLPGKLGKTKHTELYIEKFGSSFEISITTSEDPVDGSVRIIHVARDITARKENEKKQHETEERIRHSQKLESLGILAGGIAHDFNNILMVIRGYTDLAISTVKKSEKAFEYLQEINKSVRTASELSGQMLAYSGKGNFVVETASVNEIVEKLKPMFVVSISLKAELQFDLEQNLSSVKVDSAQMEQAILNLVTNASEAIGTSRGKITITTGHSETRPPGISDPAELRRRYVFVNVKDNGCGMSDDVIQKLFEPFFTTKFTGRGLGMAVVHGIVDGHKGFITVESKQGEGSSVTVFIPASGETVIGEDTEGSDDYSSAGAAPGVILVDDEKNILFVGKHTLEKAGYTVFTASDGDEAVEVYRDNIDAVQCVVLDLTMPVMDGVECLRELKRINPSVKVILSSGYNPQEVKGRIYLNEISGYLKKPYSLETLRKEVRRVLISNS